jgi:hypothetical protein
MISLVLVKLSSGAGEMGRQAGVRVIMTWDEFDFSWVADGSGGGCESQCSVWGGWLKGLPSPNADIHADDESCDGLIRWAGRTIPSRWGERELAGRACSSFASRPMGYHIQHMCEDLYDISA